MKKTPTKKPTWQDRALEIHEHLTYARGARGVQPYSDVDAVFLGMALAGEAGEVANEFKKWMRGDYSSQKKFIKKLAGEIADVQVYLQLLVRYAGIDLEKTIHEKLDEVIARPKIKQRLIMGKARKDAALLRAKR